MLLIDYDYKYKSLEEVQHHAAVRGWTFNGLKMFDSARKTMAWVKNDANFYYINHRAI